MCFGTEDNRKSGYIQSGFTLVELSIVIIIIGLLTAGGLAVGASMVERAAYIDTQKLLKQLQRSVKDFYVVNGRLPCVASFEEVPGATNFGREISDCSTNPATPSGTFREGAPAVRIGMIPTRTLGLPDSAAQDKYGSRIVYAVAEELTDANLFGAEPGAVVIRDMNNNNILTDAAFYISSTGRDRKGGYTYNTADVPTACGSSDNLDVENCDLSNAIFRDAPYNNGDVDDLFFDDLTAWTPKFHLTGMSTFSDTLWAANGDVNLYSVGTDENTANTNIGIGTASPQAGVHVARGNRALRLESDTHVFMELYPSGPATRGGWFGFGSAASDNLSIRNEIDGAHLNLLTTGDGNVGIGTTSPTDKLTVDGSAGAGAFHVHSDSTFDSLSELYSLTSGDDLILGIINISGHSSGANNEKIFMNADFNHATPDDGMSFVNYGVAGPKTALHITGAGRVGVGTDIPAAVLEVNTQVPGSVNVESLRLARSGTYEQYTSFYEGVSGHLVYFYSRTDNAKPVVFNATTDGAGSAPSSGNNAYYFRIRGTDKFRIAASGNAWLQGTLAQNSDRRLKQHIEPVENALEKLKQLHGVTYRWNGKGGQPDTETRYMGVLAQDVQAVFPEAVLEQDNGYLSLDNSALTAPLIEAIKQLEVRNTAQAEEIASLSARIADMAGVEAKKNTPSHAVRPMELLLLLFVLAMGLYVHFRTKKLE